MKIQTSCFPFMAQGLCQPLASMLGSEVRGRRVLSQAPPAASSVHL